MSDDTKRQQPETFAEANEMYLENLADHADNIMNDERLNFFRTRVRRRILACLIFIAGFSVFISMSMTFNMVSTFFALGVHLLLAVFGSRVARGFMEFPKELIDERIIQRRAGSYVYAFYLVITLLLLLIPLLLFSGVKTYNFADRVDDPIGGILGFVVFINFLPIAVFLWGEPEL